MTPIKLPLDAGINRCLAHGDKRGDWCERRANCAAHETIKHDFGIHAPAAYRKCMTAQYAGYLPLEGFPDRDEDNADIGTQSNKQSGATTPAAGGSDISRNHASEILVEDGQCTATSAEGVVVVEQPTPGTTPALACSDVIGVDCSGGVE